VFWLGCNGKFDRDIVLAAILGAADIRRHIRDLSA
jgi:hypothetical protein